MAAITTFPTIPDSITLVNDVYTFQSSEILRRGQQVVFNSTPVDFVVGVATLASEDKAVGVVIDDADINDDVAIKLYGPIVTMANGSDSEHILPGTEVMLGALGGIDEATTGHLIVGMTLESIAPSSYGCVMMYKQ